MLLPLGLGVTNIVARTTAQAGELTADELQEGGVRLQRKVLRYRPRWVAVLGLTAYRSAFSERGGVVGPQERTIGATRIWLLPNPSGLNAHYQLADLAREFRKLRKAAEREVG